jgi:sulfur carrier protein ThiS
MIKLKLNAISSNEIEIKYEENETLTELISRSLQENNLNPDDDNVLKHFTVLVDGVVIPAGFWEFCAVKENSNILIAPVIRGGEFGQMFKQVAILAAVVAVSVFLGPEFAVDNPFTYAFAMAGTGIAASLLMNSLIPPPSLGGSNLGLGSNAANSSQMYAITGQANNISKFGNVPKVYGTFKMFPMIAASPYTVLETNPATGDLVQYFYAIYDFGFGPIAPISEGNIYIGNTPLNSYTGYSFNFFDLNKPAISTGVWDDFVSSDMKWYKGQVHTDSTNIVLNKNLSDAGVVYSEYAAERNCQANPNNYLQEISIDFVCPSGLYAIDTQGTRHDRTINMNIIFCKVGEDFNTQGKAYNDLTYVSSYSHLGGSDIFFSDLTFDESAADATQTGTYTSARYYNQGTSIVYAWVHPSNPPTAKKPIVGNYVFLGGEFIGRIASFHNHSDYNNTSSPAFGTVVIVLDRPLTKTYYIIITVHVPSGLITVNYPLTQRQIAPGGDSNITGSNNAPVYATFKFAPKEVGEYKVKITRASSTSSATFQIVDLLTLYEVVTRFDTVPIITKKRHLFLELKIKATGQLNGAIQNLSAVCTSVLDVYDTTTNTWVKRPTNNPAWIFADLLTGEVNKKAVAKSRLDIPSLLEWANYCDQVPTAPIGSTYTMPRFEANFILDFNTTLQNILNSVANSAQASLNIIDGKYGVLVDRLKTVPVQVFTPRNSSNFASARNYPDSPDAVKVTYIDQNSAWASSEAIVYSDGFNSSNAVIFNPLPSFACTNYEQAWRYGRYMMAQNILRQEQISITVDFEYLVCSRGDYVQITQDVMMAGGQPARVSSVSGSTITTDDGVTTEVGVSYGYVARTVSGIVTNTLSVVNSKTFIVNGTIPSEGDLIVIGKVGEIVLDCIVKAINPSSDLTAQLLLVEKADGVYAAESSMILPAYVPQITNSLVEGITPPGPVRSLEVLSNSWYFTGSGYQYFVDLDWNYPTTGGTYEAYEVYVNSGTGFDLYGVTRNANYRVLVDSTKLGTLYSFKVLAVSANGTKLDLGAVTAVTCTPVSKTTPPSDVLALYINITSEVIQFTWPLVLDTDIKQYSIRYSPSTNGYWESSTQLLKTGSTSIMAQAQARTGTYLIKAIDWNGNESNSAAFAITSIPSLTNLNLISQIDDFPTLTGVFDKTYKLGNELLIQNKVSGGITTNEYFSDGYYYFDSLLDLGDIYTVRLQSSILASGFTVADLMSSWTPLSTMASISSSRNTDWDVETQYRATNTISTLANWGLLSTVDTMALGSSSAYTEWRSFSIGDFTGRVFQFRLHLISLKASTTPKVSDAKIVANMPSRTDIYNNVISSASTPTVITYSTPFKGPGTSPNIQITQDAAQSGDRYVISSKTLSSLEIIFYDVSNAQVSRQFDLAARGWGARSTNTI